jgi:hypothetical protein
VPRRLEGIAVHGHTGTGRVLHRLEGADVVDVGVGADDNLRLQVQAFQRRQDALAFVAGVDDHRLAAALRAHDVAVALEHADDKAFQDHHASSRLFSTPHRITASAAQVCGRALLTDRSVCSLCLPCRYSDQEY